VAAGRIMTVCEQKQECTPPRICADSRGSETVFWHLKAKPDTFSVPEVYNCSRVSDCRGLRAYPGCGGEGESSRTGVSAPHFSRGCGWKRPRLPCFARSTLERKRLLGLSRLRVSFPGCNQCFRMLKNADSSLVLAFGCGRLGMTRYRS